MSRPENDGMRIESLRTSPEWCWQKWCWWMLLAGFALRLAYCLTVDKEASFGGWDGKEYFAYGQSLLAWHWDSYPRYFNSIRPPLYPIFLTPFVAINDRVVWHIQLAQSLLGVSQAIILAKIAGRWAGQRAGNWALGIALFHPFLIYYCAFIHTEALFMVLLWFGIACLQRLDESNAKTGWWLGGGAVALALATLTRPSLQPFLAVAALWVGWRAWRTINLAQAFKRASVFTLIVCALLLPWMISNLKRNGEFTLAPGAAKSMYMFSNSPDYLRMYEAKTKEEYYMYFERLVERYSVRSDRDTASLMAEALDFQTNHPSEWWRLQFYKFKHFWTPWLNPLIFSRERYLLSILVITPLFAFAAAELFRRRASWDPFLVLLAGLVAVGYLVGGFLFHVQVRYRFPFVDVSFMILTASLLAQLSWVLSTHHLPFFGKNKRAIEHAQQPEEFGL